MTCARFQDLRSDFKTLYRMKYDLYIEGIGSGIKSDSRSFFKFANMKWISSGYPPSMFFESQTIRAPEDVVNLFAEFFQSVYVSEGEPVLLPALDTLPDEEHESHKVSQTAVEEAIFWTGWTEGSGT
jgi:hypothetical protein